MLQYSYRPNFPPTRQTRTEADQCWVDYDPIVDRPPLRWPDNARLAVMICPAILDYEFMPPGNPWLNPWARTEPPDVLLICAPLVETRRSGSRNIPRSAKAAGTERRTERGTEQFTTS